MRTYSFYVGSTDTHNAHAPFTGNPVSALMRSYTLTAPTYTHGIWDGTTENVAIYRVELATDVQAQRLAFGLAVLTGNDAILIVRETGSDDYARTFGSTVMYRVDTHFARHGDRILNGSGEGGYCYTPAAGGAYVAFLVGLDNTVSPVE